jgi:hypothetical protein
MSTELMATFVAENGDTQVEVEVERVGGGAGRATCFEGGGTGVSPLPAEFIRSGLAMTARARALCW